MKHEITYDENEPFKTCKLNRKVYADVLSEVVKSNEKGFVMALNNGWGTGKTTFVKMWKRQLELENITTIYFNAWENDFEDNALTALIGELKPLVVAKSTESFKKVLQSGLSISRHIVPAVLKALISKHIDSENLQEALKEITDDSKDLFKQEVEEYGSRKEKIKEFKFNLQKFIVDSAGQNPIVFIVDELDRCRPNYAVSLLEQIKHFFSVPQIVFVLAMNKEQLEFAVKGVYGSENIDADEYLKRFIDIEYSLPLPDPKLFANYLYDYYDLKTIFEEKHSEVLGNDKRIFLMTAHFLFKKNVSLRQQEKIFAHLTAVLRASNGQRQLFPSLFLTLIFLRLLHNPVYLKIRGKEYSIPTLQKTILAIFPLDESEIINLVALESTLMFFYNNYYSPNSPLMEYSINQNKSVPIYSSVYNNDRLQISLAATEQASYDFQIISIEDIIARVDLISRD